jgi:hypothetical protein
MGAGDARDRYEGSCKRKQTSSGESDYSAACHFDSSMN